MGEIMELLRKPNVFDFFLELARFDLRGLDRGMRKLSMKFDQIFEGIIGEILKLMEGEKGKEIKDRFSSDVVAA
ncbi:hypothetical protein Scep_006703 [Stephania cephalantha]|uniref:Uncharacterized protein n=1 Tax=Stephania cephalantha TaxID=152367 RepID=A0AAP0K8Q0_9MAGN